MAWDSFTVVQPESFALQSHPVVPSEKVRTWWVFCGLSTQCRVVCHFSAAFSFFEAPMILIPSQSHRSSA